MVTTKINWSGPNRDFLPKLITFGPDQFILVVTISFWSWPNHYGQVQINLVRPKPFWTDQNCFGHIQGISYWNVKSNLGLTDRNMLIGLCLKLSVWSWGLDIWVLSTNFQKSNIDWPHQPPTEMLTILVKNCIFDGPFHKKGLVLVIWVPGMIQPLGSVNFLMNWGCRGHWGQWGHWGCRGVKA